MGRRIRVMLCDDSAVMRRLIKTALQVDPSLEVVCEAVNGRDALERLFDAKPDVLVLDVEMPVMDGIDCVREVRKCTARLPVIMFSSLTSRGAEATLDAIDAGATDFATKPASVGHIGEAMKHVQDVLVTKIHQWAAQPAQQVRPSPDARSALTATPLALPVPDATMVSGSGPSASKSVAAQLSNSSLVSGGVGVIGVGVSTGGPQALARLVGALPLDFPVPMVVVQHMPPVFTKLLAQRLSAQRGHRVREAVDGEELRAGEILIAPGDHHLTTVRDRAVVRAALSKDPPENSCRPAVDPLFRSLAECYREMCLGVVLTGMGKDGANGAKAVREKGGRIYVQDEATSVVWGMPGNVVQCGLADRVLPIDQIANELIRVTESKPVVAV